MKKIRVMSYNIHQGLTLHKRQLPFRNLRKAISDLHPDIILLQEVAGMDGEDGQEVRQLKALVGEKWPFCCFQRNAVFVDGFHGNAILSRFPINYSTHVDITVSPLHPRGLLHAEIQVAEGKFIHVMSVHLGLLEVERWIQVKAVSDYLVQSLSPKSKCILGGDFNDWRERVSRRFQKTAGLDEVFRQKNSKHAKTFPSRFPVLPLDRIYFKGLELIEVHRLIGKPWRTLSDHLPILAEFNP